MPNRGNITDLRTTSCIQYFNPLHDIAPEQVCKVEAPDDVVEARCKLIAFVYYANLFLASPGGNSASTNRTSSQ
jgi:hypothetical protein